MALSSVTSGTQTATVTTEHTLTTQTAAKRYQLMVDLSNMVNNDVVELRAKIKTLTGSTAAVGWYAIFNNIQSVPVVISPEFTSLFSIAFTLKQTVGTSRNFDWNVLDVGDIQVASDTVLLSAGTGTGQLDFTSGVVKANMTQVNAVATAAAQLAKSAPTIVSGAAITGTLSSTQMTTDLTEATDSHYVGRTVIWTSGVLQNSASVITAYTGASKLVTYNTTPTAEAPSNTDTFIIV